MRKDNYYKVQDDVPMPPAKRKHGEWLGIAANMKTGSSVLVKDENEYMALYRAMKRLGYEVTKKTVKDGKMVWRTK